MSATKTITVITDMQIDTDGDFTTITLTKKPLLFDTSGVLTGCGDDETVELTIDPQ